MKGFYIVVLILVTTIDAKLQQVVSIISPGARYPINDLHDAKEYQNMFGEITSIGLRQQQNLGKLFKKDYIDLNSFLSKNFNKHQFQIYSLTSNRTIQSGLANLYGLYPLGQGQTLIDVDLKYRFPPFSYKNDASQQKFALPEGQLIKAVHFDSKLIEDCPNEQNQIQKNIKLQASDYNQMVITYTPFLKKIGNAFGLDPNSMNFTKISALYDTLNVDKYLGKALPSGITQEDFKNMEHLYNWYTHLTRSFNLSKALNSHKLNKTLSVFDGRVGNPSGFGLKWTTLSVQSLDIVALHYDLNISSAQCIQEIYRKGSTQALNCQQGTIFSSSLIFELHSNDAKEFYVKIRNNGKYVNLCESKSQTCAYNDWKNRIQKIILSNPQSICGKPKNQRKFISILAQ